MTAQEAHKKSTDIKNGAAGRYFMEILLAIDNASERGEFSASFQHWLHPSAKARLEEDGFKVSQYSSQKDGDSCEITW